MDSIPDLPGNQPLDDTAQAEGCGLACLAHLPVSMDTRQVDRAA